MSTPNPYKTPDRIVKKKFATVFYMPKKISADKSSMIIMDDAQTLDQDFVGRFLVMVDLAEGGTAGEHVHEEKIELVSVVDGSVEFFIEDPKTQEREQFILSANDHAVVYLPTKIAHAFVARTPEARMIEFANRNNEGDTKSYDFHL